MGHDTAGVDIDPYIYKGLFTKFHHHLNFGPGIHELNKKILKDVKDKMPDILWVDNKPFLTEST